jgi:hypothetical protein
MLRRGAHLTMLADQKMVFEAMQQRAFCTLPSDVPQ